MVEKEEIEMPHSVFKQGGAVPLCLGRIESLLSRYAPGESMLPEELSMVEVVRWNHLLYQLVFIPFQ